MGNCCTASPTTDHPFAPDTALPPPHAATAFGDPSPQLGVATSGQQASAVVAMAPYVVGGVGASGGVETGDSAVGRSPGPLIHMADREGVCVCCAWKCIQKISDFGMSKSLYYTGTLWNGSTIPTSKMNTYNIACVLDQFCVCSVCF